jgi:hypothetical protein
VAENKSLETLDPTMDRLVREIFRVVDTYYDRQVAEQVANLIDRYVRELPSGRH